MLTENSQNRSSHKHVVPTYKRMYSMSVSHCTFITNLFTSHGILVFFNTTLQARKIIFFTLITDFVFLSFFLNNFKNLNQKKLAVYIEEQAWMGI